MVDMVPRADYDALVAKLSDLEARHGELEAANEFLGKRQVKCQTQCPGDLCWCC
jgi:hypothetical protein